MYCGALSHWFDALRMSPPVVRSSTCSPWVRATRRCSSTTSTTPLGARSGERPHLGWSASSSGTCTTRVVRCATRAYEGTARDRACAITRPRRRRTTARTIRCSACHSGVGRSPSIRAAVDDRVHHGILGHRAWASAYLRNTVKPSRPLHGAACGCG